MKKFLNILMILLVYLIFCGKSCEDDSAPAPWQQKQVELARDTIQREFEADYLTEEARYAAEVKAIQEVKDLADYIEILSDNSLDSLFRAKAGEMILKMFISEDVRLSFSPVKKEKMKPVTVKEFLEKGFGEAVLKTEVSFDSLRVIQPLQKSGEETYSGHLAAYQNVILHPAHNNIYSFSMPVTINFISSRQIKVIGRDTLKVWKVSLGNFEEALRNEY